MTGKKPTLLSRGLTCRGSRHLAKGRYDQALADLDRAIELDPTEDAFAAARTEICQLIGHGETDDALPSNRGTNATS
jgi:tetratricopeptide (TPR) repeat protein